MERGAAASDQGTPDSEMGDADNDSVGYGTEMELDAAALTGAAPPPAPYVARPGVHDGVDPFEGMEFDDEEDAWTFYNRYAHRVGFSTRISVMHRSRRDGAIMSRQFVCAKEGFRTYRGKNNTTDAAIPLATSPGAAGPDDSGGRGRRTRAVTRVGCKAMIRVKKQDNAKWLITKLETAHNHPLVPQHQSHSLRPHKPLSECGKQRSAYGARRNGGTAIEPPPPTPTPLTPPPPPPPTTTIAPHHPGADGIGDAARVVLDYVRRMQAEDPAFFYAMQFVDGRPVGNVFWSDARARTAYRDFGDAVFLDDHCRRNSFDFPLVTFTGVNQHCQPILFGCAVIRDSSEASFVWLFETLLLAMSGQHPASLTTEFDGAIQSAIRKVLHQTRHRICRWHIFNEAQDKLSHLSPAFHEELVRCINMSESIDEFEANWEALISKLVDSGNIEWLDSVYSCRQQWVPVYLRDTFFGEEPSRLECTSRSSFFESYVVAKTNSQSFIQQYEKALDSCYEKEMKEEFETKYSLPDMKTSSPIEKQGADLYTRTVFSKFQQELIGASVSTLEMVEEDGKSCMYKVTASQGSEKPRMVQFNSSENFAKCTCQMFECFGIVCRHILTVFGPQGVSALSSQYILRRWTKHAIDRSSNKKLDEVGRVKEPKEEPKSTAEDGEQSQTWRYNNLCREALRYAEEGASSVDVYIVAMHALQEAANKVNLAKRGIGQVAPLAVMPLASQPPESSGKFQDSYGQQRKRRRNSNNSRDNSSPNQLKYMQQPVNFLSLAPSTSSASHGHNQAVASSPISLGTQYRQTSGSNNSVDGKTVPPSLAADKFHGFSNKDELTSAPSSENIVQGGEAKYSGSASQINESHELSQANGNKGSIANMANSTGLPQLVTVPIGFCLPSIDNSKMSAAGMNSNSGGVTSNGNASFGLRQCQSSAQVPATHSETKTLADSTDSRAAPEGSSIRAAAIAAGARIASPSDAASIIKAAQSKDAIHIRPGESLPSHLKSLAPKPLPAPPLTVPSSMHASSSHMQPGHAGFADSAAAKDAIFGSTDGSDDDEYDDDEDTDDDDDEGLSGDEAGQE